MKKMILLFAIAILFLPFVHAEENSTSTTNTTTDTDTVQAVDMTTESETKIMATPLGAKVRLLELEHKIRVHILIAQDVITLAKTKNVTTTELEAILEETKELLTTIQSTTPTTEDTKVQEFVDLKHDAVQLVKDFREKSRALLTAKDLATIKKEDREEIKTLKEELKTKKQEYNAERLESILGNIGEPDKETIEKVKKGELKASDARTFAKTKIEKAKKENKLEKIQNVRKEIAERKQKAEQKVAEAKEKFSERRTERVETRATKVEAKVGPTVKALVQERTKTKVAQKITIVREKVTEKKENAQEKRTEARNNAKAPEPTSKGSGTVPR